jgi:hypothetical protein
MRRTLFTLLILAGSAGAAPAPPPPKELAREMMVGTWGYAYGSMEHGTLRLHADGSYCAWHYPDSACYYVGRWWATGGDVCLREWSCTGSGPIDYVFTFRVADFPHLVGASGPVRVVLTGRR